jgi:hypothetical protein
MLGRVEGLARDLERISAHAARHAAPGEDVTGVLASEPGPGRRVYLCSYESNGSRSWLALDDDGEPVTSRNAVRESLSIAVMCELAADSAGGGDLEELRAQLASLRLRERPPGIEDAEDAALELERTIGAPPRLATPSYLDEIGAAARRLEEALGGQGGSPFAESMRQALGTVDELAAEVERTYRSELE